jgi:ubiquinone/menaquinone biosynthesis C-methylase UbiE
MADTIRFTDGAGYERLMGAWSRLAGAVFLDWLGAPSGLRWLDVGCGNGAFTSLICERCAPKSVTGVDPSEGQLNYARQRPDTQGAAYLQGDAMALPVGDASFDAATMALSLFFVPDPERGVAELVRATAPGAIVAAYNWAMLDGGFPLAPLGAQMRAMGFPAALPPSVETSRAERMQELWTAAGLQGIETRSIEVQRTFDSFEDWWQICLLSPSAGDRIREQTNEVQADLKERLRRKLTADAQGRITWTARANAVKGCVPAPT